MDPLPVPLCTEEAMITSHEMMVRLFDRSNNETKIGLYENVWPDTLRMWVNQGYPTDASGEPMDPADVFGYDLGRIGGAFNSLPRPGYHQVVQESDDWQIAIDGSGVTRKVWRNKSATPGPLAYELDGRATWEERFRPLFVKTDGARINAESLIKKMRTHRAKTRWICFNTSFIWENLRQTVGDVVLYESLLDDPGWIEDYNQTMLDFYIRHFELAIMQAGVPDGAWFSEDLAYNQGLFCSPDLLRRLYVPFYAKLNDYLHEKGMKVILHSCGNIVQALPLVVESGFDALHPMQVHAGCDPLAIAKQYRSRLVLIGGLDTHVLESNNASRIEQAQIALMEGMRDIGAHYVFSSDHSISTNVKYDTYRRMMDTYHQYSGR